MNQAQPTWQQNRALMGELWPRWRLEPALSKLLDEKWGSLHQDKLRECIRQHRMERDSTPDLSTIHAAYCQITGHGEQGRTAVRETRRYIEEMRGPTQAELDQWDRESAAILATATPEEIKAAKERLGIAPDSDRILGLMVEYCREHKHRRMPRGEA
jgi:hypothetical protein